MQNGRENENRANGEWECMAYRKGDGIANFMSATVPCQFVQLGECGCAPLDIYPFGLDPPTKSRQNEEDCRFLCSDHPPENLQNLCKAFGIEWWEGQNFLNLPLFLDPIEHFDNWDEDDNVLDINFYG